MLDETEGTGEPPEPRFSRGQEWTSQGTPEKEAKPDFARGQELPPENV